MLAGRLNPIALAAHQVALNCAGLSFMVPLGISSAAAVAVGQAAGRRQLSAARREGFIAIGLACAFMFCAALAFLLIPRQILSFYTDNQKVISTGVSLLAIAALFQLFDGIQTVATGALRGLGKTSIAMKVNFVGYWLFGLPIGYMLCFHLGLGVRGLWWGLTMALIVISLVLLAEWNKQTKCAP